MSIGIYRTGTQIVHTKPNILHVELCLGETVSPETGYPIYFRGSQEMEKLPSDPKVRDAMQDPIRLKEGDVIIRDGRIRIQGTGTKDAKALTMLLQYEWDPEVKWWSDEKVEKK